MLRRLGDMGYRHVYRNGYRPLDRTEKFPGVHLVGSLLKRWTAGTLHLAVSDKHLPYYLDKCSFHFN